jgi:hypothetical protein
MIDGLFWYAKQEYCQLSNAQATGSCRMLLEESSLRVITIIVVADVADGDKSMGACRNCETGFETTIRCSDPACALMVKSSFLKTWVSVSGCSRPQMLEWYLRM